MCAEPRLLTPAGCKLGEDGGESLGWASFHGKATYLDPSMLDGPEGNHEFVVYVEDRNEPGTGVNRFWIRVFDKDNALVPDMFMGDDATGDYVEIQGGNIVVPHGKKGGGKK